MSQKIIKLTPEADGRAYLYLYGSKIDVTARVNKKGRGELAAFGEVYCFQIMETKDEKPAEKTSARKKKSKKLEIEPERVTEKTTKETSEKAPEEVSDEN